jgi:hypothetical protein
MGYKKDVFITAFLLNISKIIYMGGFDYLCGSTQNNALKKGIEAIPYAGLRFFDGRLPNRGEITRHKAWRVGG